MASLFQYTSSVLSLPTTPSPSSISYCFPRIKRTSETLFNSADMRNGKSIINTEFTCNSGVNSAIYTSETDQTSKDKAIAHSKLKLLSTVCGLKTGFAAREEDIEKAEHAADELESINGPIDLTNDLGKMQGRWKLIYSSAFAPCKIPGRTQMLNPVGRLLPLTIGQVFQRIDVSTKAMDNIVEVDFRSPLFLPPTELIITLAYKFELTGTANEITMTSDKPAVITTRHSDSGKSLSLELLRIPDELWPASFAGRGHFSLAYVDSDMRITRGDMGELRIFAIA